MDIALPRWMRFPKGVFSPVVVPEPYSVDKLIGDMQEERILQEVPKQFAAYAQVHEVVNEKVAQLCQNPAIVTPELSMLFALHSVAQATGHSSNPTELFNRASSAFNHLASGEKAQPWMTMARDDLKKTAMALHNTVYSFGTRLDPLAEDYADSFSHALWAADVMLTNRTRDQLHPCNPTKHPYSNFPPQSTPVSVCS